MKLGVMSLSVLCFLLAGSVQAGDRRVDLQRRNVDKGIDMSKRVNRQGVERVEQHQLQKRSEIDAAPYQKRVTTSIDSAKRSGGDGDAASVRATAVEQQGISKSNTLNQTEYQSRVGR